MKHLNKCSLCAKFRKWEELDLVEYSWMGHFIESLICIKCLDYEDYK